MIWYQIGSKKYLNISHLTYNITLEEWKHDKDYIHILFKGHPNTEISKFINTYKSASSRLIKKEYSSIRKQLWMHELFVSSEGIRADYPRYYKQSLEKLAKEQRILSHRQKGSNRYYQQKHKVAKLNEKIANQRKDFLHKMSRQITNAYDVVCIEDLNMKGMSQVLNFGKSVADNGWGMFSTYLAYKLTEQGKKLIKIDKWYPSSKTCHVCGYIYQELQLSERKWTCSCCNTTHDHDKNASINIKRKGLEMLTLSA